jgi:hypothetical protein
MLAVNLLALPPLRENDNVDAYGPGMKEVCACKYPANYLSCELRRAMVSASKWEAIGAFPKRATLSRENPY